MRKVQSVALGALFPDREVAETLSPGSLVTQAYGVGQILADDGASTQVQESAAGLLSAIRSQLRRERQYVDRFNRPPTALAASGFGTGGRSPYGLSGLLGRARELVDREPVPSLAAALDDIDELIGEALTGDAEACCQIDAILQQASALTLGDLG